MRFSYILVICASAVMAFVVTRSVDETRTIGPSFVLEFGKAATGSSAPNVVSMVESFARTRQVNVGRLYYDPLDVNKRLIYLAVGDPGAKSSSWLDTGYQFFSRDANVEVRPLAELANISPDGIYLVYGGRPDAEELLQRFASLGYEPNLLPMLTAFQAYELLDQVSGISLLLMIGLLAVVAVSSAVTLNAKLYGVQRLHGRSYFQVLLSDLWPASRFFAVSVVAVLAVCLGVLYWYNGLHHFTTFATTALVFLVALTSVVLIAHCVTLALVLRINIYQAIRGEVTAGWAIVGSYILRGWGMLLVFTIATSAMTSGLDLAQQRSLYQEWKAVGPAYYVRIDGAVEYLKDGTDARGRIGAWLKGASDRGEVILSSQVKIENAATDILVVNDRYLAEHAILGASGTKVLPDGRDSIRMLVPQSHGKNSKVIGEEILNWAALQNGGKIKMKTEDFGIEPIVDEQLLTKFSRLYDTTSLAISNAVILVVPGRSDLISNDSYMSMASRGEVLVTDPNVAMAGFRNAGVAQFVMGFSPYSQDAAKNVLNAEHKIAMDLTNLLGGIVLLFITAAAVSVVYCRRNSQDLFVKYLHGWGALRTNFSILSVEVALGAALVGWVWYQSSDAISASSSPGAPPLQAAELALLNWEPVIAVAISALSFGIVCFVLTRTYSKFVQARSSAVV